MTVDLFIKNYKPSDILISKLKYIKSNDKNLYHYEHSYGKNKKLKPSLYNKFKHISKYLKFTNSTNRSLSIYHIKSIDKLLGYLIKKGKKSTAEKIFYNVIFFLRKKTKLNPLKILYRVLIKTRPVVDVKTIRKSGRKLEIPQSLKISRRFFLAIKWLLKSTKSRKEKYNIFYEKLALEILNSIKSKSSSRITKKLLTDKVIKSRINQKYKSFKLKKNLSLKNPKLLKKPKLLRYMVDIKKSLNVIEGSYKKKFII